MNGKTDIAMASRPIKDKEVDKLLPEHGNMRSRQAEHILGLDGVAVITHPDTIVSELTIAQLSNVYSGKVTNWSSLGGEDRTIVVFARDENSGTWDTFKSLVLKPTGLELSESASRFESSSKLTDIVSRTPGAIGFVALPYIREAGVIAISATQSSLPVMPTRFTIATEDYPLARRLFLYNSPQQNNELVNKFIDFVLSESGQNIVESLGLASQNIKLQKPPVAKDAPSEYKRLIQDAQRLSLNFRFQPGSDKLDNKAQRDLRRLVDFMGEHSEKSLLLFGFSDSVGSQKINIDLSTERARSLEKALHIRGLAPSQVVGFGEQLPLAANTSVVGRTKNRRVEVWLN